MKNKLLIFSFILSFAAFTSCQEDDLEFGEVIAPSNLQVQVSVADDRSGNVTVIPTADNAVNIHVIFEEGADPIVVTSGEPAQDRYTAPGQYSRVISIIAYGTGGASTSTAISVDLDVDLVISEEILSKLTGTGSKNWVWDSSNAGHFGVGDPAESFPNFFSAGPNQLDPCMYDDVLTFSDEGNNVYRFQLQTNDATFINWADVKRFFPDASPQQFVDECRNIDDQISTDTSFVILEDPDTGELALEVVNSTMSYWSGATEYVITELTDDKLVVRGLQDPFDPPGNTLAWYHTFVPEAGGAPSCPDGATGNNGTGNNDVLVWADEFDFDGAPCPSNWTYDLGTGDNGWGNGESQYYTDRADNVIVENGVLKITAKAEPFQGSDYTSARIKTQDLFEFTYGRVEISAKMPTGGGTWPALWMLGSNFPEVGWPFCGEMDIIEHIGNNQDRAYSTAHYPGMSGGNADGDDMNVPNMSTEFHLYELEWDENSFTFLVDGVVNHTVSNNNSLPFNQDFFFIFNVAMGGSFGGAIDGNFTESTMEVDYIRVYQ